MKQSRVLTTFLFLTLVVFSASTFGQQQTFKVGERVEYKDKSYPTEVWREGTVVKVSPEYNQVVVRPESAGSAVAGRADATATVPRPSARGSRWLTRANPLGTGRPEGLTRPVCSAFTGITGHPLASPKTGEVAERLNAPVSKTGMGGSVHRGFESLPLR